jgi:hypothetical protein
MFCQHGQFHRDGSDQAKSIELHGYLAYYHIFLQNSKLHDNFAWALKFRDTPESQAA